MGWMWIFIRRLEDCLPRRSEGAKSAKNTKKLFCRVCFSTPFFNGVLKHTLQKLFFSEQEFEVRESAEVDS
jgi:hypothetical protein